MSVEVAERLARLTWLEALARADGDTRRLQDLPDGSVVIHNHPGPWRSRIAYEFHVIGPDDIRDADTVRDDLLTMEAPKPFLRVVGD